MPASVATHARCIPDEEMDLVGAGFRPGDLDGGRRRIDTDHPVASLSEHQGEDTRAAPDVEDRPASNSSTMET